MAAGIAVFLISKGALIIEAIKRIALMAHDHRKKDFIEWTEWNYDVLIRHKRIPTGTTGRLVEEAIRRKLSRKRRKTLRSGS